ncbi:cysteine desulfurase [Lentibacillus cibarius]|uniref:cysteine desulfurase n=1 Tax=Lentibacillus cibarius TaxID=2583219 RepID=A0A549YA35_9BACI|nr:cysteine desulfurase family protein [Lentibacillus cibarius]TRM08745.1 cysteine desulfurase [Lentibacillus cibarius]TRM12796.1 cysteine desulfurase [Lentibacillus cibarius]
MERIYMDHAATTPMDRRVAEVMTPVFTDVFGNPSSVHAYGRSARQYLDKARRTMAQSINADEKEIIFTSGGTEADNLAIIGTAMANRHKGNHIITTVQEHHASLHAAQHLEKQGFRVTYLSVNENGIISIDELKHALTDETIVVSVMFVNNETGVIQPIEAIAEVLQDHQAYLHTDAVQAFGLLDIDVKQVDIDLMTVSAHKLNGPKGIAFLYVKDGTALSTLQFGGEQERKRRPGTENVPATVGFQKAVELVMQEKMERKQTYQRYKDLFMEQLARNGVNFTVNGNVDQTIASIVNISFPGTNVESLLTNFDLDGIAASSGSACTAGSVEPSHVLAAMYGQEDDRTTNSIRFSFGSFNTDENVSEAADRVAKIVKRLTK